MLVDLEKGAFLKIWLELTTPIARVTDLSGPQMSRAFRSPAREAEDQNLARNEMRWELEEPRTNLWYQSR